MRVKLYVEGGAVGANSKHQQIACRKAFSQLLERSGFEGRLPKIVFCGPRDATFKDFKTAMKQAETDTFVAMLVDSEEPVKSPNDTWKHLGSVKTVTAWPKPDNAEDEQVFFMTTCMETWIVADRATLRAHYGANLQESALPAVHNLESRDRHEVQDGLVKATRNCGNAFRKGKRSFEVLAKLAPGELEKLTGFARMLKILTTKLPPQTPNPT